MTELAKVINIGTGLEIKTIDGGKQLNLKNDGTEKKIPNNQSEHRWVAPIRDKNDINRIKQWLQDKIDNADRSDRRETHARNKLFFIVGINSGYRVSDLITLKWKDVFNKDGTFKKFQNRKEQKTGKIKPLYLVEAVQTAFNEYLETTNYTYDLDDYVFTTRNNRYEIYEIGEEKSITDCVPNHKGILKHDGLKENELEEEKTKLTRLGKQFKVRKFHVSNKPIDNLISDATRELGIEGDFAARSIRKTWAYQYYIMLVAKGDPLALVKVQRALNHRDQKTTLTYLGLTYDNDFDEMNELNL